MDDARDYAGIALEYAHRVVAGSIPACKWTVAACLRQLDDLERASTPEFPYRYDSGYGDGLCTMLELLPHIKGRWKTRTITLEPWQIFAEMALFSWVHDGGASDGLRRFRMSYEEVPRKNAKSTRLAGRALYMLAPDGEQGAECYSAATTRDQARIVWDVAKAMAKKTPEYCSRFGVEVMAHAILAPHSDSSFKALSADHDSLDGLNPHFSGVDELHAHRHRGVWDVLETATGSREQALLSAITTAGSNRYGVCYEVRSHLTAILNAVLLRHPDVCERFGYTVEGANADEETFFGVIYTVDDDDDWTDPATWEKANPNIDVSVKRDDIARACRAAQLLPSKQPNFKTKRLNIWINADTAWMDLLKWDAAGERALSIDEFLGQDCFVGVNMADTGGISPIVYVFTRSIEDAKGQPRTHYYAFGRFFIPEDAVEDSENEKYPEWEQSGRLTATSGNVTDQNAIQDELREAATKFTIREIAYDPVQANKFATELAEEGFTMVEYKPTVANMSAPMKELEAAVRAGRFHHDGDPALRWMVSNVVAHVDRRENVTPTKQHAANKIEGALALIPAIGRAMHAPPPEISKYEQGGITVL